MHIESLARKTVCVLGFGVEGRATVRALQAHAPNCRVTISDRRENIPDVGIRRRLGADHLTYLDDFDVIVRSPGVPYTPLLDRVRDRVTNATEIALATMKDRGVTVIGVTGSKGKSTTACLLYRVLRCCGRQVRLVGNIGKPVLDGLDGAGPGSFAVVEMSSFQLIEVRTSPPVAVVTNVFPEHLDFHQSFGEYLWAKANISRHQGAGDWVFFDATSPNSAAVAGYTGGEAVGVCAEGRWEKATRCAALPGRHNAIARGLVSAVAHHFGLDPTQAAEGITRFRGLPHRLHSLGNWEGIEWIDDSASTTPQSAAAAVECLGGRLGVLVLGGREKAGDFMELQRAITTHRVPVIIRVGQCGPGLRHLLTEIATRSHATTILEVSDLAAAVATALRHANPGSVCLFSPAAASAAPFSSYRERGRAFTLAVRAMRPGITQRELRRSALPADLRTQSV